MADVDDKELEKLRRQKEEMLKQIEKKKHEVAQLRSHRAERQKRREAGATAPAASVEALLASPGEGPLQALAGHRVSAASRIADLRPEMRVAAVTVDGGQAETLSYDKGAQTETVDDAEAFGAGITLKQPVVNVMSKIAEKARQRTLKPGAGKAQDLAVSPEQGGGLSSSQPERPKVVEMSAEDQQRIMRHPDFAAFFDRASLVVERALGQECWDIAADFRVDDSGGGSTDDVARMKHVEDFGEDRWTLGRPVTDVRCSPVKDEIFLAAYGQRANPSLSDPDGCMLVWNLAMKNRPEVAFTCQSAVLTAQFNKFNPALFFGGTYAGGVVLWDARAKSGPVQRTPLRREGHLHPVQAMQQVGTQNATNLVTASNDGRLCVWSLGELQKPLESIDLKNETKNRRELAVMSLAFPENETNVLYVGAEDGSVCQVHIHGSKADKHVNESFEGHEAPVTGLDIHPHGDAAKHGAESVSDLAVSSSFDWSVKLWMVKKHTQPVLSIDAFEDYVYDVRWHPTHPAVFASVDGEGHVDLWNLNRDVESPATRCENPNRSGLAVNRCHWSLDGRRLITGDSDGGIGVYTVDKRVHHPSNEDHTRFQERVRQWASQPIAPRQDRRDGAYGGYGYRGESRGTAGAIAEPRY